MREQSHLPRYTKSANEAPPAIVSVYLGEQLFKIMSMIESGKLEKGKMKDLVDLGVQLIEQPLGVERATGPGDGDEQTHGVGRWGDEETGRGA